MSKSTSYSGPLVTGKINTLNWGNNLPFGIMFVPKVNSSVNEPQLSPTWDLIPDVRLYHDSAASPLYLFPQRPRAVFSDMIIWHLPDTATNQAIFDAYHLFYQSSKYRPGPSPNFAGSGKPYISDDAFQITGGCFTHGEIVSLSQPFGNGAPFKLLCVSKSTYPATEPIQPGRIILLDAKLIGNPSVELAFVQEQPESWEDLEDGPKWTEMIFEKLPNSAHNQSILSGYRIFWIAGEYSPAE